MLFGMLHWPLLYTLSISRSVRIDAADLDVDLLLSELHNSQKMCHSLKYWSAYPQTLLLLKGAWPREIRSKTFLRLANKLWDNGKWPPARTKFRESSNIQQIVALSTGARY